MVVRKRKRILEERNVRGGRGEVIIDLHENKKVGRENESWTYKTNLEKIKKFYIKKKLWK